MGHHLNNYKVVSFKGALMALFSALIIGFASCDKNSSFEDNKTVNNMELMFVESKSLPETSIDSIKSFTSKFSSYIKANPASKNNEYYNPTVENISYACSVFGYQLKVLNIGITIDTEWDGEIIVKF